METPLNLPVFDIRTRTDGGQRQVFDPIRRKYVALTPEEWVRQHFINYLVAFKGYPVGLIAVEHPVLLNGMHQRVDIVAFGRVGEPQLVVECKAASIDLTQDTYAQAARYNIVLNASYLVVTNGMRHFCSKIDLVKRSFTPMSEVPLFSALV